MLISLYNNIILPLKYHFEGDTTKEMGYDQNFMDLLEFLIFPVK